MLKLGCQGKDCGMTRGACELEYYTLLLACQQHRMVAHFRSFQFEK